MAIIDSHLYLPVIMFELDPALPLSQLRQKRLRQGVKDAIAPAINKMLSNESLCPW